MPPSSSKGIWLTAAWAEQEYNQRVHSVLKMKPVDRFGLDLARVRYLPDGPHSDEIFLRESTRAVLADNTFRFGGRRWEAPRQVPCRKVQLRHGPPGQKDPAPPVVYYQGERHGPARPVDFLANDRPPKKLPPPPPAT